MYYLTYAFLYLVSLLPWGLLYLLSDAAYLIIFYVAGYRKEVVKSNLLIAFPEKTEAERTAIMKAFYKSFSDNFIETIKLFSISKEDMRKRFQGNFEVLDNLRKEGKKVHVHTAHFFNWEIASSGSAVHLKPPLLIVYMPIKNKVMERVFHKMRQRFNAILIPANDFRKAFFPYSKQLYYLALVADQNPGEPDNAYWTKFFGKLTPIVQGPERSSKINNAAVVMSSFFKVKRGYYRCEHVLLTTNPRSMPHGEITKQMMHFVEESIRKQPENYLWSHRRWKWQFDEDKHRKLVLD